MNTKRLLFIGILSIVCSLALPWAVMAEKTQEMPESMYIESGVYDGIRNRPPVELTHQNHAEEYGIECSQCHHEYTEGEPVKKCSECHKAQETDEVGVKLQDAMHQTCRACHVEEVKDDPNSSAPYTCAACHSEIDHFAFQSPRKEASVTFTHLYHQREYKIACTTCHHRYENGENVWQPGDQVQKCQECHKPTDQNGVVKLKTAFHRQCLSCHDTLAQSGKPAPVKCDQCHMRRLTFKKPAPVAPEETAKPAGEEHK